MVPARVWRGQAVGIAPAERPKLRRQMAATVGRKGSVSLFVSFHVDQQFGGCGGTIYPPWPRPCGQKECEWEDAETVEDADFEVQTWRQVGGFVRAVMCETHDQGIKWPQWHTSLFEEQVAVDMRVVCPQDLKKCF